MIGNYFPLAMKLFDDAMTQCGGITMDLKQTMLELAKCKCEGCAPIIQIRGHMGAGDYFDIEASHAHVPADNPNAIGENYHTNVEIYDDNKDDFRVICPKCHCSTGWGAKYLHIRNDKGMITKSIDVSNEPESPLKTWAAVMEKFHKVREAQRLLKEAGAWR